jgi:predicted amidophosphoribosyltransferase
MQYRPKKMDGYSVLFQGSMNRDHINSILRKCKDCGEPFNPIGKERICSECKLEREIYKEETRESRQQK